MCPLDQVFNLKGESPQNRDPGLFFTFKGEAALFEMGRILYDNIPCRRIDDPVVFLEEFRASKGDNLPNWIVERATGLLRYLGREDEAERVVHLRKGMNFARLFYSSHSDFSCARASSQSPKTNIR